VHFLRLLPRHSSLNWIFLVAALAVVMPRAVHAEALLVVEADTGKVLQADNATMPWYPASVTKIMTAYVALKAVKEGRLSLDPLRPQGDAEFQQADRTLSGRRRFQDRLHLRFRIQSGRLRNAQRQAIDRGGARRILGTGARGSRGAIAGTRLRRQRAGLAEARAR